MDKIHKQSILSHFDDDGIKKLLKRVEAVKNGKQINLDNELVDISATQKTKEIFN